MEYLDNFDRLEYEIVEEETEEVRLWNIQAMNGMDVAELLTYLYDDGYTHFGPMDAFNDNGYLSMVKE
jgi:hypothetical protein